MNILGINCYTHDSAAALIRDGRVVAAVEEERLTRRKHTSEFPKEAIKFCLKFGGITFKDIDLIAYFFRPQLEFPNYLFHFLRYFPKSLNLLNGAEVTLPYTVRLKRILGIRNLIRDNFDYKDNNFKVMFVEHHLAHSGSCFFTSGFDSATIVSIDGKGEWASTLIAKGYDNKIEKLKVINFPHSLGSFYSAVTQYLGFEPNSDEWKVMGLAPYGKPTFYKKFCDIITLLPKGEYRINLDYIDYHLYGNKKWVSPKFIKEFGHQRIPNSDLTEHHQDIAWALQRRTEEAIIHILNYAYSLTKDHNLCLAGGVALNCVVNGRIRDLTRFKELFIQPAAGDAGTSLGAALYAYYNKSANKRSSGYVMDNAYLGPRYSSQEVEAALIEGGLKYQRSSDICKDTAHLLSQAKIIGWLQGRMEFGPRALGNRSILADPRRPEMKDLINAKVKYREGFRPFAPSVLEERVGEFFESDYPSPFMLFTYKIKEDKQKVIPAVTHVDGTGRLQTVSETTNPLYWNLINEFCKITGIPVILNTSFNVAGEPIVCSPHDAINCFLNSGIDVLVMDNFLVKKDAQ